MFDYVYILGIFDVVLTPIILLLIFIISHNRVKKRIKVREEYKYYIRGLFFKLFFAVSLCFIYIFYYNGGDTIGYFEDSTFLINLFYKNPVGAISIFFGNTSFENHMLFDSSTGYVSSYWHDPYAFFIVRFITPLTLLTQKSYIATTILLAWICYGGVWKLFLVFCQEFPEQKKKMAYAILFIPSVAFWGSGILKDTITFAALCWLTYGIYNLFIPARRTLFTPMVIFLQIAVSSFLIISIKPYVLYPLLPGISFLILFRYVNVIKSSVIKFTLIPLIIGIAFLLSMFLLTQIGDKMGRFSFDNALQSAVDVQYDLKQDYYQGSSFDIGAFTPTVGGVVKKFPQAFVAGLFRPFVWESRNLTMMISSLENMVFLYLVLRLIFNFNPIKNYNYITSEPLLVYSLSFSVILIFIVGLTTSNFGSLVRYRIPALPFFLASLFIIEHKVKVDKLLARRRRLM